MQYGVSPDILAALMRKCAQPKRWHNNLSMTQMGTIEFARIYREVYGSVPVIGHHMFLLIAQMADMLDKQETVDTVSTQSELIKGE